MQLAHTVTAIVNAYLVGKFSFQFLDLHNIVQELADIINLLAVHTHMTCLFQNTGMILFHESDTTGRRANHIIVRTEHKCNNYFGYFWLDPKVTKRSRLNRPGYFGQRLRCRLRNSLRSGSAGSGRFVFTLRLTPVRLGLS